jgi:uncharacterized Fe-S cluster-containing MiaB family protein
MEPAWIAAGMAVLSFILSIGLVVWRGGRSSVVDLTKMESRLAQTIAESSRELETRQDSAIKMFGESVSAIREQMRLNEKDTLRGLHELSERLRSVEIWARDEFVRKESFREVCMRIENTVAEQGRTVNAALQSVRDALMNAVTNGKIDGRDHSVG